MHARIAAIGASVLLLSACAVDSGARREGPFVVHECPAGLVAPHVRCGSIAVPENREDPSGRRIALNVIVFDALETHAPRSAQFDLEGGPGFAVTESAAFYASDGEAYRRRRAVVLADMRGTGGSGALRCRKLEDRARSDPGAPLYPIELVKECRDAFEGIVDVRQYTTAAASEDIEAVRAALGYERIDLNALSYGTTLALRYIADHPDRVRTAVLMGAVPAKATPPAHHAVAAERGLSLLLETCARDAACAAQYPDLAGDVDRARVRFGAEDGAVFFERMRSLLYLPATSRQVPALLHAAATGGEIPSAAPRGRVFADGLYLSITCSESIAVMNVADAIAQADVTPFGSYRVKRQRDACAQWPRAKPDRNLMLEPSSDVPVLLISGALDPVAPTAWSVELAKAFPNGRLIVVPEGAHVMEGLEGLDTCLDAMILRFVETRSAAAVDDGCVFAMHAGPFTTL